MEELSENMNGQFIEMQISAADTGLCESWNADLTGGFLWDWHRWSHLPVSPRIQQEAVRSPKGGAPVVAFFPAVCFWFWR